ncbi:MAG: DUF2341 domain-containing protein [Thermoplasmatota archaeon]
MRSRNWFASGLALALVPPSLSTGGSPQPLPEGASAEAGEYCPWWDYGWMYRVAITIDNTANSNTFKGYQILMSIPSNSKMKPDFSDIRFVQYNSSSSQNEELSYWIEKSTNRSSASVWVNVSSIKGSQTVTIHMYCGNSSAASASDADRTFNFYDDFESVDLKSGWTFWSPGGNDFYSLTERPGWLRIKVVGDSDTWSSVNVAPFMY